MWEAAIDRGFNGCMSLWEQREGGSQYKELKYQLASAKGHKQVPACAAGVGWLLAAAFSTLPPPCPCPSCAGAST